MPINPCCCGCPTCDVDVLASAYLSSFPGTFSTTDPLGFNEDTGDPSVTSYELPVLIGEGCSFGEQEIQGGDLVVDEKVVNAALLIFGASPCDPPGTCPHWYFQFTFNDSDGEEAGLFFFWSGGSDPTDPTGTFTLACASNDGGDTIIDPSTYTAPATITIS